MAIHLPAWLFFAAVVRRSEHCVCRVLFGALVILESVAQALHTHTLHPELHPSVPWQHY